MARKIRLHRSRRLLCRIVVAAPGNRQALSSVQDETRLRIHCVVLIASFRRRKVIKDKKKYREKFQTKQLKIEILNGEIELRKSQIEKRRKVKCKRIKKKEQGYFSKGISRNSSLIQRWTVFVVSVVYAANSRTNSRYKTDMQKCKAFLYVLECYDFLSCLIMREM